MKITPPTRYQRRPFAILYPGNRSLGVDSDQGRHLYQGRRSVERALSGLTGHVLYVHSNLEALKHTTGALSWRMTAWRGRQTGMIHLPTGCRVSTLRGTLSESITPYDDLAIVLDWIAGYNVPPGSVSGMAWNLFRASLNKEVTISADAEVGRSAFYGGRQQITTPRRYKGYMAVDITAAYPVAMASRDYALSLREVSPLSFIDPDEPGIAEAVVAIPSDLPYGPLPIRVDDEAIRFPYGVVSGSWSWCELDAARQLGCDVRVVRSWAPRRRAPLFFGWWQMGQTGRRLPGDSAQLAKGILNSCWGQFAMSGEDRSEVHWTDDRGDTPYEVALPAQPMPHRWMTHVAAETTARVRRRMLLEGLYGPTKPPVHVDTDGMIVSATSPMPIDSGPGLGQWRQKATIEELDLRAPQLYRYTCRDGCGHDHARWHYVASGMTPTSAERYFERNNHLRTRIAIFGEPDRVLPRTYVGDDLAVESWMRESRGIA